MKKISKTLVIIVFGILGMLVFRYTKNKMHHSSRLTISEITNLEEFLIEHKINNLSANDVQYYMLSNTSVLIVDNRNDGYKLYTHSTISADISADGILKVVVTDRAAVSEKDISGKYAVVIECQDIINNVKIEKEDYK